MPEDLARIAVLPSHVQADRSSPFTGDLLLARTCNQGKIVDICRPSAGKSLPEGRLPPGSASLRLLAPQNALSLQARCTNAPKSHAWGRAQICAALSCCSPFASVEIAREVQGAIQIYNDVSARPVNTCCWYRWCARCVHGEPQIPTTGFSNCDVKREKILQSIFVMTICHLKLFCLNKISWLSEISVFNWQSKGAEKVF